MTRQAARELLDLVKLGVDIPKDKINRALMATGDIPTLKKGQK